MNPDTFNKALDACVEYRKQLDEKTNEVARLREELEKAMSMIDRDMECEKEIARLRELLNRAEHSAKLWEMDALRYHQNEMYWKQRAEKAVARLAPAPEEPDNDWKCPHCGSTTGTWFSRVEPMGDICEDCGKAVDEEPVAINPEKTNPVVAQKTEDMSNNEWRELGPDEVIQEGDQVMGWEKRDWAWSTVDKHHINLPAHAFRPYKFRTRRPLPNSPESEGIKKQEEMPLENELNYLTREASRAADIHNHVLIVDCIRYLRDEIQNLKQTNNQPTS